jgi:hypothetical protein
MFSIDIPLALIFYVLLRPVNSFALIVAPGVANATFIAILVTGFPAELGLTLWLIVFGVNVPKWNSFILSNR